MRPHAVERALQQRADGGTVYRPGVPVRIRARELGRTVEIRRREADLAQGKRRARRVREIVHALCGVLRAERACNPLRRFRHDRSVVGERVRQDDGVGRRMRKIDSRRV